MNRKIILVFSFFVIYFALSLANECEDLLPPTNTIALNDDNTEENPIEINGPKGAFAAILVDPSLFSMSDNTSIVIHDIETNTTLAELNEDDLISSPTFYLFSFTSKVSLYIISNDENFPPVAQISISYALINESSLWTEVTDDGNNWLSSNGSAECPILNYRQTWLISSGSDNVIHYYLARLLLDDTVGDYLALGSGTELFATSLSMMISGNRTNYGGVEVYGNISYVHLFSKYYSSDFGFSLFYNSSLYIPPTDEPPTTVQPAATLNATIPYEKDSKNETGQFNELMNDFSNVIGYYATLTCQGVKQNYEVNLTVDITEVVEVDPCLVIVYYIDIYNGSCEGNKTFTLDSYNMMMINFSSNINKDFGRKVGSSCPPDNTIWLIAMSLILAVALLVTVVAFCSKKTYLYKKVHTFDEVTEPVSEAKVIKMNEDDDNRIEEHGNPSFKIDHDERGSWRPPERSSEISQHSDTKMVIKKDEQDKYEPFYEILRYSDS